MAERLIRLANRRLPVPRHLAGSPPQLRKAPHGFASLTNLYTLGGWVGLTYSETIENRQLMLS